MQAEAAPVRAQAASVSRASSGASPASQDVANAGSSAADGYPSVAVDATHAASAAAAGPRDPAAQSGQRGSHSPAGAQQLAAPLGFQATLDQQICRAAALEQILAGQHKDAAPGHEASNTATASMPAPAQSGHVPGARPPEAGACEPSTGELGARAMSGGAAAAGLVMLQLPRIRVRVPSPSPRARAGTCGWRACFCAA